MLNYAQTRPSASSPSSPPAQPMKSNTPPPKLAPIHLAILRDELALVDKKIAGIKGSYEALQTWSQADRLKLAKLSEYRRNIRHRLGLPNL